MYKHTCLHVLTSDNQYNNDRIEALTHIGIDIISRAKQYTDRKLSPQRSRYR